MVMDFDDEMFDIDKDTLDDPDHPDCRAVCSGRARSA
jgi:hypothetical protein